MQKSSRPNRCTKWQRFSPPRPSALSRLVFDLIVDGTDPREAESKIRAAAKTTTEAERALSRFRFAVGRIVSGVKL